MLAMGLVVPIVVVAPAAAISGGLLAGIVAGWIRNGSADDGARSRLVAVSGVAVAVGLVIAALEWLIVILVGSFLPMFGYAVVGAGVIGVGATWAAYRLRGLVGRTSRDVVQSLALLAGGAVVIIIAMSALCATVLVCRA
jgi:hypothetical protein